MSAGNPAMPQCPHPISAAILSDYWLGELPAAEAEPVEEHLLACDRCGDRLREVIALAVGIGQLARQCSLRMVVSDDYIRHAVEDGLRIREYAPPPGGSVQCTVTEEDDMLIGRLFADFSGATRVDLSICDADGVERQRLADVPVPAGRGSIVLQESITVAKAAPSHTMIGRLFALDDAGDERLLGEYTFNHTRSLPGPGSWA